MLVILVDGRNACYRFGWAGRSLHASDGSDTGAVHGMMLSLVGMKYRHPGAKFAVVWDGLKTRNSWRVKLFPDYKACRNENPSPEQQAIRKSVGAQIGIIKNLLDSAGVPQIEIDELEADDVIGILSEKCQSRGWSVSIYSNDQDYLQLMPYGVSILTAASGAPISDRDVSGKWKCGCADLLKLRALLGDKSDGIPRPVSGVGPVAAAKYIACGVDPSLPRFEMMDRVVRQEAERLCAVWPRVHLTWRLMRILRYANDPEMPDVLATRTVVETRRVIRELSLPAARAREHYLEMIEIMSSMGLDSAIQNRGQIWNLNSVAGT